MQRRASFWVFRFRQCSRIAPSFCGLHSCRCLQPPLLPLAEPLWAERLSVLKPYVNLICGILIYEHVKEPPSSYQTFWQNISWNKLRLQRSRRSPKDGCQGEAPRKFPASLSDGLCLQAPADGFLCWMPNQAAAFMCFNFRLHSSFFFDFGRPTWEILVFWFWSFLFSFHLFIQDQAVCLWMWAFCRVISARINLLSTRRSCGLRGGYDPCCCFSFSFSFSFSFCFLMNTHKVANEAAEWESEELSAYAYEYIHDVQGWM